MKAGSLSVSEVLDGATDAVARVFAPWVGGLWITTAPLRLLQVHFAGRLLELGPEARQYGNHLHGIALAATAAFVLSVLGRAVFVRACALRLRARDVSGREVLRLPAGGFFGYVYVGLLLELLFYATAVSVVAIPVFVLLSGLAAATSNLTTRPGLLGPLLAIFRHGARAKILLALLVVFATALVLSVVNLYFVFQIGLWLLGGVAGLDLTAWQGRLAPSNPGMWLVLAAGASLLVEPYWLAALVVYIHKVQSRESGEDLRLWFDRLRTADVR